MVRRDAGLRQPAQRHHRDRKGRAGRTRVQRGVRLGGYPTASTVQPEPVGYLVQLSFSKNEADAQASYRALQGKFPTVLGSRSPVIKRVDLGDKGVYYRAVVGPFGTAEEAAQFCGNLRTAGGQCFVLRN